MPAATQFLIVYLLQTTSLRGESEDLREVKLNFVQLGHRDSRTLEAARKRVPVRVDGANNELKYYSIHLTCVFGDKKSTRIKAQEKGFIIGNLALHFTR